MPKTIAPDIFRQRLLIEGYFERHVDEAALRAYLPGLAAHLGLRPYGEPVIFAPATGMGSAANAGFDAFMPLIDSGIAEAAGIGLDQFLAQFEERGLSTPIVEVVSGWGQGQDDDEIDAQALPALDVAARAGARVGARTDAAPVARAPAACSGGAAAPVCRGHGNESLNSQMNLPGGLTARGTQ